MQPERVSANVLSPMRAGLQYCLFGSSGTVKGVKALAFELYETNKIKRKQIDKIVNLLTPLSVEEIARLPGVNPRRADILLAGSVLLGEVMDYLDCQTVTFTKFAMRDGMIQRELEQRKLTTKSSS